jgi:type IV secretory pathway ATPase VirB11/archaellum biosynthesis ATPase
MTKLHVSQESISEMTQESVAELAKRLERDAYENAFEGLQDWHLLRAVAFQRPELVQNYTHLLDIEPFDEE